MEFEEQCVDGFDDVFMDSLEESDRLRVINKNQEKEITMYKENTFVEEITQLKICLEEAKLVEESLKKQVQERKKHCENLELEIVGLRKELEKTKALNLRFAKGFETLEEIITKFSSNQGISWI